MTVSEKRTLHCSFCEKDQHQVKKMIAGPAVFICDECVILCLEILVEGNFHDEKEVTREQQVLRREKRLQEIIDLFKSLMAAEEDRVRKFVKLKKKMTDFDLLYGPPKPEVQTT